VGGRLNQLCNTQNRSGEASVVDNVVHECLCPSVDWTLKKIPAE